MSIFTNSGLRMNMESAKAASQTIVSATNADPGVFTVTTHGYNDGDIILVKAVGMDEVNERMFQVYAKATSTFQLEDKDGVSGIATTAFGVFTSGTVEKITLGTTITGVQEFSAQGGEIKFVDTTTVQDKVDKQVVVGATARSYNMTMLWDPLNAAQQLMIDAFEIRASKGFRIMWPDNTQVMFYGTVGYSGAPGGGNQGVTTSPASIAMNGNPTYGI